MDDVFKILSPDEHPIFVASLPNERGRGPVHHEYVANDDELSAFIRKYDHPGRALYFTVASLRDGMSRSKETVEAVCFLWGEIDFKDHSTISAEEIKRRVATIPLRPTLVVFSGHGLHLYWQLNEPENAAPGEGQRIVEEALGLVSSYIGGDSSVAETARLMRLPGSHNTRHGGENIAVEVVAHNDVRYEFSDIVDFLLDARPILPTPERPESEPSDAPRQHSESGPVDVDARLAAMRYKAQGDAGIHKTQLAVTGSLTRTGLRVDDTVELVLAATRKAVADDPRCADWNWDEERTTVAHMCYALVNKAMRFEGVDLSHVLPDDLFKDWQAVLQRGDRPYICSGNGKRKVHVRGWGGNGHDQAAHDANEAKAEAKSDRKADAKSEAKSEAPPKPRRFKLIAFNDMRPGVEPLYLVDELIPVAGLVDIWGKAKCFKSFWTLDLCAHIAMGWEYRDRRVRQGVVVYCAFEGGHGYKKRIEGLRRHYQIADDTPVPLYVMSGQANLITEHRLLIAGIREDLGEINPAVVVLDTLNKSLVGSESKDVDMGNYVRAAEAIRDAFGCVVIIVHHCGLDETRPRGHTSLPGAVDAQLAVVREGMAVVVTVEFMRDGPEDTMVASTLESIDVGEDDAGKTLTSLVVMPGEGFARTTRAGWPRSLTVFRRALTSALAAHGEIIRELDDAYSPQVRAVDLEHVRTEFYATYPTDGTPDQRQDARKKQFKRHVTKAQTDDLIRVRTVAMGAVMIWPAPGTT